jgi:hypothetical protein
MFNFLPPFDLPHDRIRKKFHIIDKIVVSFRNEKAVAPKFESDRCIQDLLNFRICGNAGKGNGGRSFGPCPRGAEPRFPLYCIKIAPFSVAINPGPEKWISH